MPSKELEAMLEKASGLLNIAEGELSKRIFDGSGCLSDQELYRIINISSGMVFDAYNKALAKTCKG